MIFVPLEKCKQLAALGCKSESGFHYLVFSDGNAEIYESSWAEDLFRSQYNHELVPAFIFQDFCGHSVQSLENARLRWGDEALEPVPTNVQVSSNIESCNAYYYKPGWKDRRLRMFESTLTSEDEWLGHL